jgi:regulator of sigma E protease
MSILIFIIILLVLVLVHEFGHFWTAKKFGIRVDEFGFGFPPKLFGFKKGETEYTFNLLPIGGFVKIFGEDPNDENTNGPERERSFVSKAKWKQAIVLFAGIFANFLLAWLLLSIGFMSGLPSSVDSQSKGYELTDVNLVIVSVAPDSPAFKAGLKSGDKIISVDHVGKNEKIDIPNTINPETFKNFVVSHPEKEFQIGYTRLPSKDVNYTEVTPALMDGEPAIGISMDEIGIAKLPLFQAFYQGLKLTIHVTQGTAVGLFTLISDGIKGQGSFASVTGPVGMVGIVGDAYQFGFVYLLSFAALISINLAIINLIPFPALDGGRLFFLLIEKIKGSPLNTTATNMANMIGFSILILLMLIVTYHDIARLF